MLESFPSGLQELVGIRLFGRHPCQTGWTSDQAVKAAKKAANARAADLKKRLEVSFPGSAGLLYQLSKWSPAWPPARGSVSKQLLTEDPQAAAEAELESWKQIWPEGQIKLWELDTDDKQEAPEIGDADKFKRICQALEEHAGLGVCSWHPRCWAFLGQKGVDCIMALLQACVQARRWPRQFQILLYVLLGKEEEVQGRFAFSPRWFACGRPFPRRG